MSNDERIAALEAQVARLTAVLHTQSGPAPAGQNEIDRRALLRRGGLALAGLAGATAVPTVLTGQAAAANGDFLVLGKDVEPDVSGSEPNLATVTTGLDGLVPGGPVLRLKNTASTSTTAHPVLRITPSAGFPSESVGDVGDLMVSDLSVDSGPGFGAAFLNFAHTGPSTGGNDPVTDPGNDPVFWGNVYTSQFASFIELLSSPVRVLDTRPTTKIGVTTAGKRGANVTTVVNVSSRVVGGLGVIGNVTVTGPEAGGFLTIYPGGARPTTSSINFVRGQTIANFTMVGLFPGDTFRIYTSAKTHILFDVVGFLVPDAGRVVTAAVGAPPSAASRLRGPSLA